MKKCQSKNCERLVVGYSKYCPKHLVMNSSKNKKQYPHHILYHNQKWKKLREKKLSQNPLCEVCFKTGEEVDHILNHKGNVVLFFEFENLQTLCKKCHARKSMMETKINYYKDYYFKVQIIKSNYSSLERFSKILNAPIFSEQVLNTCVSDIVGGLKKYQCLRIYENNLKNVIILMIRIQHFVKKRFVKIEILDDNWKKILGG